MNKEKEKTPVMHRVLAIAGVLLFLFLIIGLIVSVVKKADAGTILAWLFGLIVVPCIFYVFLRFSKRRKQK